MSTDLENAIIKLREAVDDAGTRKELDAAWGYARCCIESELEDTKLGDALFAICREAYFAGLSRICREEV